MLLMAFRDIKYSQEPHCGEPKKYCLAQDLGKQEREAASYIHLVLLIVFVHRCLSPIGTKPIHKVHAKRHRQKSLKLL